MDIIINCDVTEFYIIPDKRFYFTTFNINDKSLIISFCNEKGNFLSRSEIKIDDAKKLAKLILNY